MENPIKMDDLGVSLFLDTPMLNIFRFFFRGWNQLMQLPPRQLYEVMGT